MSPSRWLLLLFTVVLVEVCGVGLGPAGLGSDGPAVDGGWTKPLVGIGTLVEVILSTNQTRYAPGEQFLLRRSLAVNATIARAQGDLYRPGRVPRRRRVRRTGISVYPHPRGREAHSVPPPGRSRSRLTHRGASAPAERSWRPRFPPVSHRGRTPSTRRSSDRGAIPGIPPR